MQAHLFVRGLGFVPKRDSDKEMIKGSRSPSRSLRYVERTNMEELLSSV